MLKLRAFDYPKKRWRWLDADDLSQSVKIATVTITDEQFVAAGRDGTPIQVIAAQGAGKVIRPLAGLISVDVRGGGYSFSNESLVLLINSTHVFKAFSNDLDAMLKDGGYPEARFLLDLVEFGASTWIANFFQDAANLPVVFRARDRNDVNDPLIITDGDPANRIAIQIAYTVFDVVLDDS
jgi:hypothetical protein